MEYRRGRITQEYRRWGRPARLARFSPRSLSTKSARWGGPPDRGRRPRRPLVLVRCQSRTRGSGADEGVRPTATYITYHGDRRLRATDVTHDDDNLTDLSTSTKRRHLHRPSGQCDGRTPGGTRAQPESWSRSKKKKGVLTAVLPHAPFLPSTLSSSCCPSDSFSLTKPNTSCKIEWPASLRSEDVRVHPGMPFGFPSENTKAVR